MHIVWSIAGWLVGTLLIAAGMAYLGDSLYIRHEVAGADSAAAFGNVRFYYATKGRDGKYIIYQDSPQNEVCVHALFPHYGYKPCWFASRKKVRVVAGPVGDAIVNFFPEKFFALRDHAPAKQLLTSLGSLRQSERQKRVQSLSLISASQSRLQGVRDLLIDL